MRPRTKVCEFEAAENQLQHLHREYTRDEATNAEGGQDRLILILQPPEYGDSGDGSNCHCQSRDDVAEIAAEEAVAVFSLDAFGEILANLGDGVAVRAADSCSATLSLDPGE